MIGVGDAAKLTDPWLNLSASFGVPLVSPAADVTVERRRHLQGGRLRVAGASHPRPLGRSRGLSMGRADPPVVFVGDVIFAGSIGRTDFPDGDLRQLVLGIRSKLFTLPDETILLPGHGPATTVGEEKRSNPFVGLSAR